MRKKLRIDVVDELHAIRQRLAKTSQEKIREEAEGVRKKLSTKKNR
ncbi:MAG: hypothetical protein HMLIMOIP_000942 [Candidatus Nitrosomirales archaeon]|jgi:hypothetical protein